jgi:hypothetical protein
MLHLTGAAKVVSIIKRGRGEKQEIGIKRYYNITTNTQ